MLDDAIRLLKFQETYDKEISPRSSYIGLSLNDTLSKLIIDTEASKSSKLQSTFKITDEAFWNIKLRSLVTARRWDELRTWSLAKKPPIGYEVSSTHIIPLILFWITVLISSHL
jgi:vacuolar protein sorting-associated protein 16